MKSRYPHKKVGHKNFFGGENIFLQFQELVLTLYAKKSAFYHILCAYNHDKKVTNNIVQKYKKGDNSTKTIKI